MKRFILFAAIIAITSVTYNAYASPGCDHPNFYVQGCEGPAGPPGPTGATGPAGPQGEVGPQGTTGPKGETGATGATGAQGVPGPIGLTGTSGVDGTNGLDGADGVGSVSTVTNSYENTFDDNRLTSGIASVAAMGSIPDAFDGRTGIGVGFSNYRGVEGIAIGVVHKVEGLALRATIATSSGSRDAIIGLGATASF